MKLPTAQTIKCIPAEAIIWLTGLIALAAHAPGTDAHIILCPLKLMGWDYCMGCGLGRAIAYALRGDFAQSFHTHPLGIMAVIVLLYRIVTLTVHTYRHGKNN
jgi:hypothetical protein